MRHNVLQWEAVSTFITTEGDVRSLIKPAALFLVCLIGIGFYLGWFSLSNSNPDPEGDKVNFNLSVDKEKMKSDIKKVEGKVVEEIKELKGKVEE